MKSLPVRRAQFKTADFAAWLAKYGAEVGQPTNMYEVIRYRAYGPTSNRAETHIVYAKESGLLTFTGSSREHYVQFITGARMYPSATDGNPPGGWVRPDGGPFRKDAQPPASAQSRRRQKLIDRDGDGCWFCGLPLGDDMTIEHLVPKSEGGRNALANYALAHSACNCRAANLPLVRKIALREELHRDRDRSANADRREAAGPEGQEPGPRSGIAHPPQDPPHE